MLRSFVIAVLVGIPAVAAAQAPTIHLNPGSAGEYIIDFETPPIIDYSYQGPRGPGTTLALEQDVNGKLKGTSHTSGITISSDAVITGKVKTKQGLPYVQMNTVDDGEIDGDPTHAVGKMRASLYGWGADATLVGELLMRFCMTTEDPIAQRKRRICMPNQMRVEEKVPHAGSWQVMLSMERFGNYVEALGWLVTSAKLDATARLFELDAHGKISPKTGLAKLVLRMQDPSPGTVTIIGAIDEDQNGQAYFTKIHEVKGKLLGQSFDEVFDSNDDPE